MNGLEDYKMDERMDGSMEGAAALMKLLAEAVMPQTQPPYADATRQNSGTYEIVTLMHPAAAAGLGGGTVTQQPILPPPAAAAGLDGGTVTQQPILPAPAATADL